MCSKRCKHTLRDRIPLCAAERRCCEPQPVCMIQKEELSVDCDHKPKNDGRACDFSGCTGASGGAETTGQQSSQPSQHDGINTPVNTEFEQQSQPVSREGSLIKAMRESGNRQANMKSGGGANKYDQSTPSSIRHMDEWEAMAVMMATNGRVWAGEDIGFARQYKAALSAVNTKFEEEAANMAGTTTY